MFTVRFDTKSGRHVAKCAECGHVQSVSSGQARGLTLIMCQSCGVADYTD